MKRFHKFTNTQKTVYQDWLIRSLLSLLKLSSSYYWISDLCKNDLIVALWWFLIGWRTQSPAPASQQSAPVGSCITRVQCRPICATNLCLFGHKTPEIKEHQRCLLLSCLQHWHGLLSSGAAMLGVMWMRACFQRRRMQTPATSGPAGTVAGRFIQTSVASKEHFGSEEREGGKERESECLSASQFFSHWHTSLLFPCYVPCMLRSAFGTFNSSALLNSSHIHREQSTLSPLETHTKKTLHEIKEYLYFLSCSGF